MSGNRWSALLRSCAFVGFALCLSCSGERPSVTAPSLSPPGTSTVSSDSALFALVTQTQPFGSYSPFPNLATSVDGTLNGTGPHQPLIRVRMNAQASGALQNGRLPSGARFPDGSVVFKEILTSSGGADVYAVMYKDRTNPLAGNGWLWAEYRPTGATAFSITNRGSGCTGCHSLEQGSQNDFVRIFERQR